MSEPVVNLDIGTFDMSQVGDDKVILFIGKRGSGKSTLVLDDLYHHQDFPIGTVVSPTDDFNHTFQPHVPSIFIHEEYTPVLLEQILKRQKDICRKCTTLQEYRGIDPRTFVVFDDCLADGQSWKNDKNIKWIFMNGRHTHVTFILTMQYALGIPPSLRTNVDYIFICREPKVNNQRRLYEHYAGMFPSFEIFRAVLSQCTKNLGCLVIKNDSTSDRLQDQVFCYRANIKTKPDWNTFHLCYPIFWKGNERIGHGHDERKNDQEDELDRLVRKKTPKIVVRQVR
jgi:hypothetical protein